MTLQLLEPGHAKVSLPSRMRARRRSALEYFGRITWSPTELEPDASASGLRVAETTELEAAHKLSEAIMRMRLAPLCSLASAHSHTQGSAWVFKGSDSQSAAKEISGVMLTLPLNWDGEAALRTGRFNSLAPRIDLLCAPGEEIAALYIWLTAGADARARRNLMRTILAWVDGPCARIRIYAKAASEDGARALAGLRFQMLAPDAPNIFFRTNRH